MKKFGVMISEVLPHLGRKPATILYPFERVPVPETLRGKPVLDTEKCRGCRVCVCEMVCPAEACKKITIGEDVERLAFWYDRCVFCGECAERCPYGAVTMTKEFELAAYDLDSLYAHPEFPKSEEALQYIEKLRERRRMKEQREKEGTKVQCDKKADGNEKQQN
ncbi:MAG TPA: NADH-plastoquinone oxidoreductase subunit [Peptococcaceae bacterium]|nr:MAG: Subunit MbhN of membrane-bound energy-converting [Ni,Fe]-hydrogenase [Clostridia bacterium 41_269]HBT20400.1 NADH-plastoquinone oxidoreductase subunit [Peptococcaceae bacterium]